MNALNHVLLLVLTCRCILPVKAIESGCENCGCCVNKVCASKYVQGYTVPDFCTYGCIDGIGGNKCYNKCPEDCVTCEQTIGKNCATCDSGKYLTSVTRNAKKFQGCVDCPETCTTCTSETSCQECTDGHYNTGQYGDCSWECPTKCKTCTSSTNCQECYTPYYNQGTTTDCSLSCPGNCDCSSPGICSSCQDGFFNVNQQCINPCPDSCNVCLDQTTCQSCKDGYFNGRDLLTKNEVNDCALQCRGTCSKCTSYDVCISCKHGHYGSYCQSGCSVGCTNGICNIDDGTCECKDGFAGRLCNECASGRHGELCDLNCPGACKDMLCKKITGHCVSCKANNITGDICDKCIHGVWGTNCSSICPKHCDGQCLRDTGHCESCEGNFQGNTCNQCSAGYYGELCDEECPKQCYGSLCYRYNGTCRLCNQNYSGLTCEDCIIGFYGEACDVHCPSMKCENNLCNRESGACTSCQNGFYGLECEYNCSQGCDENICDFESGTCECKGLYSGDKCCVDGGYCRDCSSITACETCENGYFGTNCNMPCPSTCAPDGQDSLCEKTEGKCFACSDGFHGGYCNNTCSDRCANNRCDQKTEHCVDGCVGDFEGPTCAQALIEPKPIVPAVSGGVSAAVVIIAIIIVMLVVIRRRRRGTDSRKDDTTDKQNIAPKLPGPSKRRHDDNKATTGPEVAELEPDIDCVDGEEIVVDIPETQNVVYENVPTSHVAGLDAFVRRKSEDDYKQEFEQLPKGLTQSHTDARKPENVVKNRYNGIYPYNHSRVKIKGEPKFFINACFIDGFQQKNKYIASLGPTAKATLEFHTFWTMVWHMDTDVIVMLTNLLEPSGNKCEQYWPDQDCTNIHHDITVSCQSEEVFAEYTVRTLTVEKKSKKRTVVQFHYTAWPDKSIPDEITSLVEFRQRVRSAPRVHYGPVIIHCSAGIGRTGTYIALDRLTEAGEAGERINVYDCVYDMRQQRVNMVQTLEQYKFLHKALVHTLTFESGPIRSDEFGGYIRATSDSEFNTNIELLKTVIEDEAIEEKQARSKNGRHRDKNRKHSDIPDSWLKMRAKKTTLNLRRKWLEKKRKRTFTDISSPSKLVIKKPCFANPTPKKSSPIRIPPSKRKRLTSPSPMQLLSPSRTPMKSLSKRKLEFSQKKVNTEIEDTLLLLRTSISNGTFSTNNIVFKLLQDSLKWHACTNLSTMRYSEAVKQFFWTGKRLLGGQFLRFMRGYGHQGMVVQGAVPRGIYSPLDTEINLPVPSDTALREYRPEGIELTSPLTPGIIHQNIDLYSDTAKTTSFVVMFDGKKIVPNFADVFLLGVEDEPKLADIQARFEEKIYRIGNIVDVLEDLTPASCDTSNIEEIPLESKNLLLDQCKRLLQDLADVSKSLRETSAKKKTYMITLEKKFTETEDGKYKFAINKIRTLLYQISICLDDLLGEVDIILQFCAELNNTKNTFKVGGTCLLEEQDNFMELKYPEEVRKSCDIPLGEDIQPHLLKQRTPEWFQLRTSVKVTGSVMQRAVGLDTLASQREYFDTIIGGKEAPPINDIQKNAMDHGSKNELNAVATVLSKIAPVYYPGLDFYEEGAYVVKNSNGKDIVVVSPDGSLRFGSEKPVSLEMKCPCPQYAGVTPVFYNVKERHVVQSLAEAHVIGADEHLYISWSKQSTTVFRMKSNDELFNKVLDEVNGLYYVDVPKRPTRVTEEMKLTKAKVKDEVKKAELLCEVPSVVATTKTTTRTNTNTPYFETEKSTSSTEFVSDLEVTDVIQTLVKCKKTVMEAYNFQKPVASEVMIYLLSDMDRTWKQDIGHGLPVAFLYKGYSFPMTTSRRILESVLEACDAKDIHVPCVAFDGQFASLKDFDNDDSPLSLFAFNRQFWSNIKKMSKKELIDSICMAYAIDIADEDNGNVSFQNGKYVVSNIKTGQRPIKSHPDIIYRKVKLSNDEELVTQVTVVDNTGLDEEVTDIILSVMPNGSLTTNSESESVTREDMPLEDLDNIEIVNEADTHKSSHSTGTAEPEIRIDLDDQDFENMFQLCTLKGSKSFTMDKSSDLKDVFTTAERMDKELKGAVLHEILNYLNVKLTKFNISIKQSLRKADKINKMCEVLGITSRLSGEIKVRKQKHVKTLKAMCIATLQKRTYPKEALTVAYAEAFWPLEEVKWYNSPNTYVSKEVCITSENNNDIVFKPLYSPELVQKTGKIQVRVMDGTHIRTNIKSKLIRTGLGNIKLKPWKDVALSGKTNLPLAMLEIHTDGKIMHQQSDPHVRTMFSEEVERELVNNKFQVEANFCRLFREWHEAEDKPGLSARERVLRSLRFREWLLNGYDFGDFPPRTQYVKGIPRVTYEGLICSIDAHILLYAMCKGGTFNWRSVSTLVAENFMSELAERSQNNHGVPSGATLGADMTKISELHAMRLNPKRSFQMKTSKSRAYSVPELHHSPNADCTTSDTTGDVNVQCQNISRVALRNHVFDMRTPGKAKRGLVRKFGQVPRGVQSVRNHYKVDESKILPSTALGLLEDMVEI